MFVCVCACNVQYICTYCCVVQVRFECEHMHIQLCVYIYMYIYVCVSACVCMENICVIIVAVCMHVGMYITYSCTYCFVVNRQYIHVYMIYLYTYKHTYIQGLWCVDIKKFMFVCVYLCDVPV